MHYLTVIGVILIFAGTILTYYGQQIKSDDSNRTLIDTINSKDKRIDTLSSEIAVLKSQEEIRIKNRLAKIRTVAERAHQIFSESALFYQEFISMHGDPELVQLLTREGSQLVLTRNEIVERVRKVFTSTTMLNDSKVKISGGRAITELEFFYTQMAKIYAEANSILEHYGDLDHELIKQIDDIRSRSKMLVEMIPLLDSVEGGVNAVFGEKVPDQWAGFFSQFFFVQYQCNLTCRRILE